MDNQEQNSFQKSAYEWASSLVFALTLAVLVFSFFIRVVTVNGISMLPTYNSGDRLLVSELSGEFKQGDVVVAVDVLDDPIIKRVVATEGQTVEINTQEGVVYVDGRALDESAFGLQNGITTSVYTSLALTALPQTVPKGCVFLLGDNRGHSKDSRYTVVGMVDNRKILGKAVFGLFPLNKFGPIG